MMRWMFYFFTLALLPPSPLMSAEVREIPILQALQTKAQEAAFLPQMSKSGSHPIKLQPQQSIPLPIMMYEDIELMAASQPVGMIASRAEGVLWVAASGVGSLARIDINTKQVSYIPLGTGARPVAVVEMRDNSILALDRALNVIHHFTPETGETIRIAMPHGTPFLDLAGAGVDPENRLWFAGATGWLGCYDPASGEIEVNAQNDLRGLSLTTTDQAGSLWFLAGKSGRMIRIDRQKSRFDSMALPKNLRGVRGITIGAKGEIWMSFAKSQALARYLGRGNWQTIRLPLVESIPQALLVRSDGSILYADAGTRKLMHYLPVSAKFEEIGELGEGGVIKAMIDLGTSIVVADFGADRLRIFRKDEPTKNK